MKKLTRPRNGVIAGVCAGIADFLKWNRGLFRTAYILFSIFSVFLGLGIYILYWILVPKEKKKDINAVDGFYQRI